jgi:C1A family cysteine protease
VAFYYISNYGISLAKDYPWKGFEMPCNIKKGNQKIFIAEFESIISENDSGAENRLKLAVCGQPVAVTLTIGENFVKYKGGIIENEDTTVSTHCVLVIGFRSFQGQHYWIIRNSFGVSWGYEGFGLI